MINVVDQRYFYQIKKRFRKRFKTIKNINTKMLQKICLSEIPIHFRNWLNKILSL